MLVAAHEWGSGDAALAAGAGAAIAGVAALHGSMPGRQPLVVGVSLGMGLAALLGALTAEHDAAFVGVVVAWCFSAGMLWAIGANAGLFAAAASGLLVIWPDTAQTVPHALGSAALVAAGGLTQAVLIVLWPQRRWRVQHDALADAYRSLADYARILTRDPDAEFDAPAGLLPRESLASADRQTPRRRLPGYGLPGLIEATLRALHATDLPETTAAGTPLQEALTAAADVLAAVADGRRGARSGAVDAEQRLAAAVTRVENDVQGQSMLAVLRRLQSQLGDALTLRFGGQQPGVDKAEPLQRLRWTGSLRSVLDAVRTQLTWGSPVFRHAIRLAVGVGAAVALARFREVPQGYWMALTTLMVLRPGSARTYSQTADRLGGNFVGIAAASTVMMIWHPAGLIPAVLAVVCLGIGYVLASQGYLLVNAAVAAAIVFTVDATTSADPATLGQRLLATLIGGAIAIWMYVVVPDPTLARLRQYAAELLEAQVGYAAAEFEAFVHQLGADSDTRRTARQRALNTHTLFDSAAEKTRVTSSQVDEWLATCRAAVNAIAVAAAVLETQLPRETDDLPGPLTEAIDEYIGALRGDDATGTIDVARLSAANERLRADAARLSPDDVTQVLLAQVETITHNVVIVALLCGRAVGVSNRMYAAGDDAH